MSGTNKITLLLLLLVAALVWLTVLTLPSDTLKIIACDVGQGDAFLIIHHTSQILVDAGPDNKVLECLGRYLPFWDRDIEVVILTHPQIDHFGGINEVLSLYKVKLLVANAIDSSTKEYQVLKSQVGGLKLKVTNPTNSTQFDIGKLTLDVISPIGLENPRALGTYQSQEELNDLSIVFNLSFGEFDALFTGDISPKKLEEIINNGEVRDIEYLKVPHHGSKNGLTTDLLMKALPEVAVISAGKKNRFGHPHEEVIKLLKDNNIKFLRTDERGDIIVESDGKKWWIVQ